MRKVPAPAEENPDFAALLADNKRLREREQALVDAVSEKREGGREGGWEGGWEYSACCCCCKMYPPLGTSVALSALLGPQVVQ